MTTVLGIFVALLPWLVPWQPQGPRFEAGIPAQFQDRRIRESSGVVVSRKYPRRLWTMNDSGGDPVLFLTDSSGAVLGSFLVPGAENRDCEAMGRGACGNAEGLYIGDTGDNSERRSTIRLYRLPEPAPLDPPRDASAAAAGLLVVEYPDGSHDVEALYVEPDGAVVLVTKGRSGGIKSYRVPASAWSARTARAERLDSLPIQARYSSGHVVTDAAIAPDGERVVIRTYRELWFFLRGQDGRLRMDPTRPRCDITGMQTQGEGVDWWEGDTVVLTSERGSSRAGTILIGKCPR